MFWYLAEDRISVSSGGACTDACENITFPQLRLRAVIKIASS